MYPAAVPNSTLSQRGSRLFLWLARFLGRVEVRLLLSAAIIVSLLPFAWASHFDGLFLVLFGFEFLARVLLVFRGEDLYAHGGKSGITPTEAELQDSGGWRWPRRSTLLLMFFDLLALVSFLPALLSDVDVGVGVGVGAGVAAAETRWLRLFRLSRMVLLLSYWAPLVRDVWTVMLRRERGKQVVLMGFLVLALSFAGAVVIDQLQPPGGQIIDFNGDDKVDEGDGGFLVHLWWSFRQIQDPGNMLTAPQEVAGVLVSLALTIAGLFMVSFLIGLGTDVVREMMELSRLRPPGMRGHTLVVNINPSTQQLVHELLRYSEKLSPRGLLSLRWLGQLVRDTRRSIGTAGYLVVGRSHDPPDFLRQPELARIVYRQGHVEDETFLVRTDVADAQRVVLLADLDADDPDAETIQALLTITESLREADLEAERRASLFGSGVGVKRTRLLIAEILDESNMPAAEAAISSGRAGYNGVGTRAFIVPSERMIALFIACVTRRPGVGRLLEELLTSHGHELYTMFFSLPGLGYQRPLQSPLSCDPSEIMGELIRRARSMPSAQRIIPVGVLLSGEPGSDDLEVHINPKPDFSRLGEDSLGDADPAPRSGTTVSEAEVLRAVASTIHGEVELGEADPQVEAGSQVEADSQVEGPGLGTVPSEVQRCVGFVAIADNFGRIRELADDLYDRPRGSLPPDQVGTPSLPDLVRAETTPLRRVLICGFRSGTVSMIEALIKAEPQAQIMIMVDSEAARDGAWDDFDAHTKLLERKLLGGHHGPFRADKGRWALTWIDPEMPQAKAGGKPHIRLVTGDWSSSRQLTALPLGFGGVESMDAVVLVSSEHSGSDARTAKTLMKLETLTQVPRIVAEVLDVELARRMRRRQQLDGGDRVRVYSIQELRAFFMFQSVVVPAFDMVHAELMGPWGQSFVRLTPAMDGRQGGSCSFEELSSDLLREHRILCAVELAEPGGQVVLHVGSGDPRLGDRIDLCRLVGVWVITDDSG